MSMLDGFISELAQRFGMGDRAGPFVAALLSFLANERSGGVTGFLDRFRHAGLGSQVESWLGPGPNAELSSAQLEHAIGRDGVDRMAVAAGTSPAVATPALAYLVPRLIDLITPDGIVPAALPPRLARLAALGAFAPATIDTAQRESPAAAPPPAAVGGSGPRKLIPVLALLLLGFLGWQLLGRRGSVDRTGQQTAAVADSIYTEPAAPADPIATPARPVTPADQVVTPPPPLAGAPDAVVGAAVRRTMDALAGLRPGYSARELVYALNLNIINFESGSAEIPAESHDVLDRSASAIWRGPPGTVLEVGAHTDNTGSAAANNRLSTQRAEAVRVYLIRRGVDPSGLRARGFGSSRPVADNGTEAGRLRNRRIEFTLLR